MSSNDYIDAPVVDRDLCASKAFLAEYLTYRIENDPAKNMLYGAFGKDWTTRALRTVIFPIDNK